MCRRHSLPLEKGFIMNLSTNKTILLFIAIFIAIAACFIAAIFSGVPFFLNYLNDFVIGINPDWSLPLPSLFNNH